MDQGITRLKLLRSESFKLLSEALSKRATTENDQAGFKETEMFPLNDHLIPDEGFAHNRERDLTPELFPASGPGQQPEGGPAFCTKGSDQLPVHHPGW